MADGTANATARCASEPRLHARGTASTNESSRLGPVADTHQTKLRVAVALLVEATVTADLLELEPLHRNGVIRTSLDAQCAANAALFVEHHGGTFGPAVGVDQLGQRPFRLHLVDVDHVDDAFGADVRTGAAQDAAEAVEPDVVVA